MVGLPATKGTHSAGLVLTATWVQTEHDVSDKKIIIIIKKGLPQTMTLVCSVQALPLFFLNAKSYY
jgi:peroxiredoxin